MDRSAKEYIREARVSALLLMIEVGIIRVFCFCAVCSAYHLRVDIPSLEVHMPSARTLPPIPVPITFGGGALPGSSVAPWNFLKKNRETSCSLFLLLSTSICFLDTLQVMECY